MMADTTTSSGDEAQPRAEDDPQPDQHEESKKEPTGNPTNERNNRIPSTITILSSGEALSKPMELPSLPYSLRDHKLSIGIIWTLLTIDTAILPLALFYPLWYGTDEQPWVVITITTCVFGLISGAEWLYRTWKLLKDQNVRPLGSRSRWQFDFFHISYTLGYVIALIELVVAAAPDWPLLRLCALPTPSFILFYGAIMLLFSLFENRRWPVPFRISSLARGSVMRPCTYMIIGDVIAVDTGLGKKYREALSDRYEASPIFRKLLRDLDLFWGLSAVVVGAACFGMVLDGNVQDEVAYGLGWGVPPIWAGVWAFITIKWVQRTLKKETQVWNADREDNNV